jgi:hypothetical protein
MGISNEISCASLIILPSIHSHDDSANKPFNIIRFNMPYYVDFNICRHMSLDIFRDDLLSLTTKEVGTVQLAELCSMNFYPHGLYLLYSVCNEERKLQYVGKATSRSFIERVPSHFDQRHDAWFNTIPKRIMEIDKIDDYAIALAKGLSLHLVLIGIQNKKTTMKFETALRSYLKPRLNPQKKPNYSGAQLLSSF